jgi:hypothetical protein
MEKRIIPKRRKDSLDRRLEELRNEFFLDEPPGFAPLAVLPFFDFLLDT